MAKDQSTNSAQDNAQDTAGPAVPVGTAPKGDQAPGDKLPPGAVFVDHVVTEADLETNPELKASGAKVGETVQLPVDDPNKAAQAPIPSGTDNIRPPEARVEEGDQAQGDLSPEMKRDTGSLYADGLLKREA